MENADAQVTQPYSKESLFTTGTKYSTIFWRSEARTGPHFRPSTGGMQKLRLSMAQVPSATLHVTFFPSVVPLPPG